MDQWSFLFYIFIYYLHHIFNTCDLNFLAEEKDEGESGKGRGERGDCLVHSLHLRVFPL